MGGVSVGRVIVGWSQNNEIVHEVISRCRVIGGALTETTTYPPFSHLTKMETPAVVRCQCHRPFWFKAFWPQVVVDCWSRSFGQHFSVAGSGYGQLGMANWLLLNNNTILLSIKTHSSRRRRRRRVVGWWRKQRLSLHSLITTCSAARTDRDAARFTSLDDSRQHSGEGLLQTWIGPKKG